MRILRYIKDALIEYCNLDISDYVISNFRKYIKVPVKVDTLHKVLTDKGDLEVCPNDDYFLIGIWTLNYLAVCGYFRVAEVGKVRRYFKSERFDVKDLNRLKLAIDVTEAITYGRLLYTYKQKNMVTDKSPILEKFKVLYLTRALPRSFESVVDLLNRYFTLSNTVPNISVFNDSHEYSVLQPTLKDRAKLNKDIGTFNKLCTDKDGKLIPSDSLRKLLPTCKSYNFRFVDSGVDFSDVFNSLSFYNGYFSDLRNLETFNEMNDKYMNGSLNVNYCMGRTLIEDQAKSTKFIKDNMKLIDSISLT